MNEVVLPNIGEGIAEGEIIKWCVQAGDVIQAEQTLLEVLTDKASVEIPSPVAGIVDSLLFQEGDLVPVGHAILKLRQQGATSTVPAHETETQPTAPSVQAPVSVTENHDSVMATPSVRRYARERDVNLNHVKGSGSFGRILLSDIDLYKQSLSDTETAKKAPSPSVQAAVNLSQASVEERIALRGIRRKIAEQMVKAKFTAPDFFYADEADLSELVALRQELAPGLKAEGYKLTYLPFVVKAVVSALKKFPTLNASLDEQTQEIVLKKFYNIGIATASPNGLTVPVIQNADQLSILDLAQEIERLAQAVRNGSVQAHELRGGTFTITNIGAIGGLMSAPIINHPEVAIMALNKIYQKPMVHLDQIAIRWACNLSLSVDHRVVDGSECAHFTNHIIQLLQNPKRLLLVA